jgi:hypothetical protein
VVKSRSGHKVIAVVTLTMILFITACGSNDPPRAASRPHQREERISCLRSRWLSTGRVALPRALYRAYHSQSGAASCCITCSIAGRACTSTPVPGCPPRFRASAWGLHPR